MTGALTLASRRFKSVAVLKQEELQSIADDTIKMALKSGANEVEAYVYQGLATSIGIERGQIARSSRIIDRGIGIRVIANKAAGFSYTNILERRNTIDEATRRAISSAEANKPDLDWNGLPSKKPYSPAKNTYDRKIVELRSEDLVTMASSMLDAAETMDKRVFPVEGGTGASYLSVAVANSNGIASFDQGTFVECSMATVVRDKSEVTPVCFEFNAKRCYDIDPEWVGKEAARLAISAMKPEKMETKTTQVIFTQFAMQELLYYTLINAVKADYVQRGQSAFKGKIGSEVASELVTICDNGLLDGGLRTHKFDGEGVPQQKTSIIEKGVLRSFIYDNYSARRERRESTGNAARAGYLSTPNVEATNFYITSGSKSPEELVSDVHDGLIVYYLQGAHSSNPASGDFSVVATPAWRINKGEVTRAARGVMVAGNIFKLLANVTALANNERQLGQLVAPWILAENVRVIGKQIT